MGTNISIRPLPLNIPFHNVKSEVSSNLKSTKGKDSTVDTVKISQEAIHRGNVEREPRKAPPLIPTQDKI